MLCFQVCNNLVVIVCYWTQYRPWAELLSHPHHNVVVLNWSDKHHSAQSAHMHTACSTPDYCTQQYARDKPGPQQCLQGTLHGRAFLLSFNRVSYACQVPAASC